MPQHSARLAPDLAQLFELAVVASELHGVCDPQALLPAEGQCVIRARVGRRQEFAAGRVCARLAMAQFGVVDYPLTVAPDRRPLWPPGLVGSITHTEGYCGAVVAPSATAAALGVDVEVVTRVTPELWSHIATVAEVARLALLEPALAVRAAALIFAAKEAFYKCQYPLTREWLNFHDVQVEFERDDARLGAFAIRPQRTLALQSRRGLALPLRGRYRFHDQYVAAGMGIPALAGAADPPQ